MPAAHSPQVAPENPVEVEQSQEVRPVPAPFSEHVPPFEQVVAVQSWMSSAHATPSHPAAHAQEVRPVPAPFSEHVPC